MALGGFFNKLKQGLSRSTQKLSESITGVFNKRKLDDAALEELEDALIAADLGTGGCGACHSKFPAHPLRQGGHGRGVSAIRCRTRSPRSSIPLHTRSRSSAASSPHVLLVVGVNGTGKTTTIGKMAQLYGEQGMDAVLVAGDTFRAAAVEQLQVWGQRTGCPVIAGPPNADAAGLAFDALTRARAEGATYC